MALIRTGNGKAAENGGPDVAILLPKGISYRLHADKPGLFPLISFDCKGLSCDTIQVLPLSDPSACVADYDRINSLMWTKDGRLAAYSTLYGLLAEVLGISEVYLRKLFLNRYGITPKQYISDIRISAATQQLTDTNMRVTAISEACGFSNVYHFCRAFKKKTGLTPTQYARQNRIFRL